MTERTNPGSAAADLLSEVPFKEYLAIGFRRKWWIILTTIAVFFTVLVVVVRMPNVYRSETMILVDPQKVPDSYVASTVTSSIADRLATIKQEVMSPTRLKKLIDTLNLFPDQRGRMSDQALVEKMQEQISVEVVTQGGRQLSAFRVGYAGKNPVEVAQVANQLAGMFIAENLRVREQQSIGTAEFLQNELEKTKRELDEKEKELGVIKSKYILDLPDSKQYHLEALATLRNQLRASQDRIDRAMQERMVLQSMSQTSAPTVDLDATGGPGSSPYELQIQRTESRLSELRARYGPEHPDVKKVTAQLNDLKKRAAEDDRRAPAVAPAPRVTPTVKNPVIEAQLQKLNQDIEEQKKLQPGLNSQINFHTSKLERVPVFEQQMSGMMRDYDTLRAHYTSLLDKKLQAEMSSALESRQKAERFVILDPAQIPLSPFSPNRTMLILAGLIGGLIGGVALAIARDMTDMSVRSSTEAVKYGGTPLLIEIPQITSDRQKLKARAIAIFAVAGTAAASIAFGFLVSILQNKVL